jgi:hypothetical protein
MTELEYAIKNGGLTPKRVLRAITRRGFTARVLGGLNSTAAARLIHAPAARRPGNDFTIAIIPDPQYLAEFCPDHSGRYYAAMMNWIVNNKNTFNIKAVVGVGDCVNATADYQYKNAQAAWRILDAHGIAFTTPPGNHDYSGGHGSRAGLGAQFASGYFSAGNRSSIYGAGIDLGHGDMAYWAGSFDRTGANTAVKFSVSGIKLLILAMDFFAGNDAWSWAYDVTRQNSDCECYITTHGWLTANATQFQREDAYGPNAYGMPAAPYSNSAAEAWRTVGVNRWPNLCAIFSGHDLTDSHNTDPDGTSVPAWYWQLAPVKSRSRRRQTVQQLFANAQQIDGACSNAVSEASGAGQTASVFLLTRRLALGLLEGRMISTHSGNWFKARSPSFPAGSSWSTSETLLFSVVFNGLGR